MKYAKRLVLTTCIGALIALTFSEAASFRTCNGHKQTWRSDRTTMYINTNSMPVGSIWDLQTQYMMHEWNTIKGSNFTYYVGRDTDGSVNTSNGKNEISFLYKPSESYLGITNSRYKCYWLFGTKYGYTETDIHLNTRYSWTSHGFTGSNTGSPYNFQLVMLHELGHALGLLHSDNRPATMNTYYYNGGPNGHYNRVEPHGDDRYGLRILYPDSSTGRDVSVSRFHNTGGSTSKNIIKTISGSRTTRLYRGSQYDLQYTMENLGTQSESVNIRFYISTNSYISTADTYIGSTTWNMGAGSFATATKRITIPTSLASRTYYIGYIIDPYNNIPENDNLNNRVSLLDRITVP